MDTAIGSAWVIPIRDRESIEDEEFAEHPIRRGERVLLRTYKSEHCWETDSFVEDFVHLSAAATQYPGMESPELD